MTNSILHCFFMYSSWLNVKIYYLTQVCKDLLLVFFFLSLLFYVFRSYILVYDQFSVNMCVLYRIREDIWVE